MICDKCVHQNACINAYASMGYFVDETKVKDHSRDILQCKQFADKSNYSEIVKCKDCKHAYINSFSAQSGIALCKLFTNRAENQIAMQQDDYCSYGERKEEK